MTTKFNIPEIPAAQILGAVFCTNPVQADGLLLFKSDFAPGAAVHSPDAFAPGWSPESSGSYPRISWTIDARRAAGGGNGHFIEGRRAAGSDQEIYLQCVMIPAGHLKGRNYELRFDFKVGSDPEFNNAANSGILDFHFVSWVDDKGWHWENLRLFNQDQTFGDPGVSMENTFRISSVTAPDAAGWRSVTMTGEFKSDAGVRIWMAPWTFGDANTAAGHFSGSWGINNVSLRAEFPEYRTPVEVGIFKAREVEFFGESGRFYRIESTANHADWILEEAMIPGEGRLMSRFFHAISGKREYRVVEEQPNRSMILNSNSTLRLLICAVLVSTTIGIPPNLLAQEDLGPTADLSYYPHINRPDLCW